MHIVVGREASVLCPSWGPAHLVEPWRCDTSFPSRTGSSTIKDDKGTVFSSPEAAVSQAAVIAAELAQDGDSYDGCVVYVTDEHGNDIGKVPVAAAMP